MVASCSSAFLVRPSFPKSLSLVELAAHLALLGLAGLDWVWRLFCGGGLSSTCDAVEYANAYYEASATAMTAWLLLMSLCNSDHCLWMRLASSLHPVAAPDQPVCTLLAAGSGRSGAPACARYEHFTWTLRLCFLACSASVMARSRLLSPVVNSWWRLDRIKYIALQQAGSLSSGGVCGTEGRPWHRAAQLLCANPEQQPTCSWGAGRLPKSLRARACQRCCS